jgi:hypothetical protein
MMRIFKCRDWHPDRKPRKAARMGLCLSCYHDFKERRCHKCRQVVPLLPWGGLCKSCATVEKSR